MRNATLVRSHENLFFYPSSILLEETKSSEPLLSTEVSHIARLFSIIYVMILLPKAPSEIPPSRRVDRRPLTRVWYLKSWIAGRRIFTELAHCKQVILTIFLVRMRRTCVAAYLSQAFTAPARCVRILFVCRAAPRRCERCLTQVRVHKGASLSMMHLGGWHLAAETAAASPLRHHECSLDF